MNIYVFKNDQQYGPYTADQLREFIQQGSFTLEDYACGDGQNWVPISQIPGFAAGQAQAGQPVQAQSAAGTTGGSATKMKVMVILFAVLGVAGVAALVALLASFWPWPEQGKLEKTDSLARVSQPSSLRHGKAHVFRIVGKLHFLPIGNPGQFGGQDLDDVRVLMKLRFGRRVRPVDQGLDEGSFPSRSDPTGVEGKVLSRQARGPFHAWKRVGWVSRHKKAGRHG